MRYLAALVLAISLVLVPGVSEAAKHPVKCHNSKYTTRIETQTLEGGGSRSRYVVSYIRRCPKSHGYVTDVSIYSGWWRN